MKRLIEEVSGEGLESLMGKNVTFFCDTYIYTGKLVGVNDIQVKLESPKIVYETGPFNTTNWEDAQALPHDLYILLSHVESYGEVK